MKKLTYRVIVESDKRTGTNEDAFTAYVPVLGLAADGDTIDEALKNIEGSVSAFVQSMREDNLEIPEDAKEQFVVATAQVTI
ncbi:MAG: type II toxin-antitoxin system HicB family antitoxin [Patescibacteria group bacterium]